jgi:hemoglobin-like flavoprotein
MSVEEVQKARDSLSRCSKSEGFLDRFYELFMGSSEEIRKKFEHTDFLRQKKMLEDSLFLMMAAAGTTGGLAYKELSKLAEHHSSRQLDIKPQWYDVWLTCLMKTVSEHDSEYSTDLDAAWRASLKSGIELLKSRY